MRLSLDNAPRIASENIDAVLDSLIHIADLLGGSLGARYEIAVHDLRREEDSVVHVVNGHVTQRQVGQGIRDLLGVLNAPEFENGALLNYQAPASSQDRTIRASTQVYFDESDQPVLALCMNVDVTDLIHARDTLSSLAFPDAGGGMRQLVPGGGARDIGAVLDMMIDEAIEATGNPVEAMTKTDKQAVVRMLDLRGAFHVRHAHTHVAKALRISKESVFRYLQQVKGDPPEAL